MTISNRTNSIVSLFALTAVFGTAAPYARAQQTAPPLEKLITVKGAGIVREKPNLARVTLGVQSSALDEPKAASINADRMADLLKAVHSLGIDDKDVQTSGYNVIPQFRYTEGGNRTLIGYRVENSIRVTLRAIEKSGTVLDAGIKAGANMAGVVEFGLDDETSTRDHDAALAKAVADARRKALVIASAGNAGAIELVGVVEDVCDVSGTPPPTDTGSNRVKAEAIPAAITPGELTITVSVTSTYRFDPQRKQAD